MTTKDKINNHIYVEDGCETPREWAELACAALERAGLHGTALNPVRKTIMEWVSDRYFVAMMEALLTEASPTVPSIIITKADRKLARKICPKT